MFHFKISKKSNFGFTLIELLVVISIIGILSRVVLASITVARTKAYDAKVQGQLSHLRAAAEIYQVSNGNYGASTTAACNAVSATSTGNGMFSDPTSGLLRLSVSVNYPVGENTIVCNSNGSAYAASDNLYATGTYWCVDSTGVSKQTNTPLASSAVSCP